MLGDRFATTKSKNRGQVAKVAKSLFWSRRGFSGRRLVADTDLIGDWLVIDRLLKQNDVLSPTDR